MLRDDLTFSLAKGATPRVTIFRNPSWNRTNITMSLPSAILGRELRIQLKTHLST